MCLKRQEKIVESERASRIYRVKILAQTYSGLLFRRKAQTNLKCTSDTLLGRFGSRKKPKKFDERVQVEPQ